MTEINQHLRVDFASLKEKATVADSNPRADSEEGRIDGLLSLALGTDARATAQWLKGDQ